LHPIKVQYRLLFLLLAIFFLIIQFFQLIFKNNCKKNYKTGIMKNPILFLVLSIFTILLSCANQQDDSSLNKFDLPYIFEKEFAVGFPYLLPVDIDRDGKDEFLDVKKKENVAYNMCLFREPNISAEFQVNFSKGRVTNKPFAFLNNKNELRILVSLTLDNKAYLCVYSSNGDSLGRYEIANGIDRNDNGFWDGQIRPVAVEDLNNDGALDLLIIITTYHDLHPRGVCAFDLKNKTILWKFHTGAYITDAIIDDLIGDGDPEIILGSSTVNNGSIANGTNDSQGYLIILDNEGEELIKKEWGEFSVCKIQTLDINGDRKQELVWVVSYS